MANARTRRLPSEIIPDAHIATSKFVDMGGHLTLESHFGNDPLAGRDGLIAERNRQFHLQYPDLSMVFHAISNNNCNPFICETVYSSDRSSCYLKLGLLYLLSWQ